MKNKKKKIVLTVGGIIILVTAIALGGVAIYLNDYYHKDEKSINEFINSKAVYSEIEEIKIENNYLLYKKSKDETSNSNVGFIFYPGGKVEYTAYTPLMYALSVSGFNCFLTKMPKNLAIFNINAADQIISSHPEITSWYIGGHSLGGAMASTYAKDNLNKLSGLVLLGAYSTVDLSSSNLDVMCYYGSNDKIINRKKLEESKSNLPSDAVVQEVDGFNHGYFGMYGGQKGDGESKYTNAEQIELTAKYIYTSYLLKKLSDNHSN